MTGMQPFAGQALVPGWGTRRETTDNIFTWGPPELGKWVVGSAVRLSGAARDTGNTDHTNVLRAGLPLGMVRNSLSAEFGMLKEWSPTAVDGTAKLYGFLEKPYSMVDGFGANINRYTGRVLVAGNVRYDRIIYPGQASYGLGTVAGRYQLISQMFGRFQLDTPLEGDFIPYKPILAYTADVTLTTNELGFFLTNRGASGSVTFTLPDPLIGTEYTFFKIANQTMTISSGSSNILSGGAAASSLTVALNKGVRLVGDGTNWLAWHSDINT